MRVEVELKRHNAKMFDRHKSSLILTLLASFLGCWLASSQSALAFPLLHLVIDPDHMEVLKREHFRDFIRELEQSVSESASEDNAMEVVREMTIKGFKTMSHRFAGLVVYMDEQKQCSDKLMEMLTWFHLDGMLALVKDKNALGRMLANANLKAIRVCQPFYMKQFHENFRGLVPDTWERIRTLYDDQYIRMRYKIHKGGEIKLKLGKSREIKYWPSWDHVADVLRDKLMTSQQVAEFRAAEKQAKGAEVLSKYFKMYVYEPNEDYVRSMEKVFERVQFLKAAEAKLTGDSKVPFEDDFFEAYMRFEMAYYVNLYDPDGTKNTIKFFDRDQKPLVKDVFILKE